MEPLSESEREQIDTRPDEQFYTAPRYVHHVDEGFRRRLTELYASELSPGDRVLDLMSSWVSHLPRMEFSHVLGHGLNGEELAANDRLDDYFVQDLNEDATLPLGDASVDAVLAAASVQYLQYPGAVLAEVRRVLRPGGVCVVSFSDRMFWEKAVRAWRERSMDERASLVVSYFEHVGGFDSPRVVRERRDIESDPFYAVVARRAERAGERVPGRERA
jgi:SAM-dependent methyltransferase